jgi:glucan 1,3-beta-glucosidase
MSRPLSSGDDVAYDPVPNPRELPDLPEAPYDPLSEPYIPTHSADDLNPDEPSITLVPPRFLGTTDGEGIRESLASYSSHPHSEGASSLYALNPESLSLRGSTGPANEIFLGRYHDDPRTLSEDNFDGPSVPLSNLTAQPRFLAEKEAVYTPRISKPRRNVIILSAIGGLILLIVAVGLPVYFLAIKHPSNKAATNKGSDTTTAPPSATSTSSAKSLTTGGNGSIITMENGTKFTYVNQFGGFWIDDPNDPFNNSAQAQSWSPPLSQPFDYDNYRVRGYVTCSCVATSAKSCKHA